MNLINSTIIKQVIYIIAIINICQYAIMWKDKNIKYGKKNKNRQMFPYDILKESIKGRGVSKVKSPCVKKKTSSSSISITSIYVACRVSDYIRKTACYNIVLWQKVNQI